MRVLLTSTNAADAEAVNASSGDALGEGLATGLHKVDFLLWHFRGTDITFMQSSQDRQPSLPVSSTEAYEIPSPTHRDWQCDSETPICTVICRTSSSSCKLRGPMRGLSHSCIDTNG